MNLLTLPEILTPHYVDGPEGEPIAVHMGPGYENDNHHLREQNAAVSVALSHTACGWTVSAFKVGTDGEPDTDDGEVFVKTFQNETRARWLYRACLAELRK